MELLQFCTGFLAGAGIVSVYFYKQKRKWREKSQIEASIFEMVENSRDIIYYNELQPTYRCCYMSPSVDVFLGKGTLKELSTNPNKVFELVHPEDLEIMQKKMSGEANYCQSIIQRLRHQDGSYRYFEEYATPIYEDGKLVAIQGIMRNIDEKIKLQQNLEYQVSHDALTMIFNRRSFEHQMERFNVFENTSVAVLLCDLDNLKFVNDHFGHKKGDEAIRAAAQFLSQYFCDQAIVSRIGGDEFAIIIPSITKEQVVTLYEGLPNALAHFNDAQQTNIGLSIGYAFRSSSIGVMDTLYTEADAHMYEQKRAKKSDR